MFLVLSIINYRTPDLIVDCLHSLQSEIEVDRDLVVVVDNASGDDSIEQIERSIAENKWKKWVKLLPSPINGGFSAGHNLVFKQFTAEAYLLLGSDTIVRSETISILKNAMQRYPQVGLIGPRLEGLDGTPQISCFRDRSPVGEFLCAAATGVLTKLLKSYDILIPISEVPIEAEWISFACVLIRREVIQQIGEMDEGYFMYFEDMDYCRRSRASGWQILYLPDARVVHIKGGSGEVQASLKNRQRLPAYYYTSRSRYFAKFYARMGLWLANLCWLAGRTISYLREVVGNKTPHTCKDEVKDIWKNGLEPMKLPNRNKSFN
jgi:N-acetylglucosaminyl-diphospho-decaprenol L-rhamnosyltransferase